MLAKYVSVCEWRIASLLIGEYYCEKIASMIRLALKEVVTLAPKLMQRDKEAVKAVMNGMVLSGIAANYATISRPVSGCEHYFSHVWDMRGVEFSLPIDLHGNQCAVGTFIACNLYEKIKKIKPNKEKALDYVKQFNYQEYKHKLREFLGKGAESLIELEKREKKYDLSAHTQRLEIILQNWSEILNIINKEIPPIDKMEKLFNDISLPKTPAQVGVDDKILKFTFETTKDIRDKYVLSRLAWDLGVIDELF
jgi:glycerol-1-phosphate dehydrogenase [NAD(P)+]